MKKFVYILLVSISCVFMTSCDDAEEVKTEVEDQVSKDNINKEEANQSNEAESSANEILTIDNCGELASMLSNNAEIDESYLNFASKYKNMTIEFNGRIDYVANHADYKTRYDILVSAGDYDPDHQIGPTFKFKDVSASNLGLDTLFLEDEIKIGKNVQIVAKVKEFNNDTGLFFLDPISIKER